MGLRAGDVVMGTAPPAEDQPVGWLTGTGQWSGIGSALNWVGDRVAVVGPDPGGVVAAMAAAVPAEPDVVTVIGLLDDAWPVMEAVLPIAVPPGSRARLAVADAGAPEAGPALRLARELTATIIAPRTDVLLVPGGSLFAVDGWLRYDAAGAAGSAGRRTPRPEWEARVEELRVPEGVGDGLSLLPIPAGVWLFPQEPGTPAPDLDDPAYGIPLDVERPVLLIGRPGRPDVSEKVIRAVVRALPVPLRRRLLLAPYGSMASTLDAATSLAREDGKPVLVTTGVPALTDDAQGVSRTFSGPDAGRWEPLATRLTVPPSGPARPTGPVRGLDGYPRIDERSFRLNEHWVAEVTQSGLWVRPPRSEAGADVVRAIPWDPSTLRIFVGVPGEPPGHELLPLLGALVGRMPAETRRRVKLAPEPFAIAVTASVIGDDDGGSDSAAGATGGVDSGIQRPLRLRGLPPYVVDGAVPPRTATVRPPAPIVPRRPPASPPPVAPVESASPAARPASPAPPPGDLAASAAEEPADEPTAEYAALASRLPAPRSADVRLDHDGWGLRGGDAHPDESPSGPAPAPAMVHRVWTRWPSMPVVVAFAVLAVATTTGYVLSQSLKQETMAVPSSPASSPQSGPTPILPGGGPSLLNSSGPASGGASIPAVGTGAPRTPGGRTLAPSAATAAPTRAAPPHPAPTTKAAPPGLVNGSGRNLAAGGTVSASSVEQAGTSAAHAIDGSQSTRWSSVAQSDPQWLAVDLGAVWQVTQVRLLWQRAYATAYHVDVSLDGTTWRTVYETSHGTDGVAEIAIARTPVRHVRVVGTARASTRYGYSIIEFEVR
ncbi:hypothetical protein JOD64_000720 [Micromonospora luteifusca]|uniref:F5/8 type C domain-containing protein n=1 Tax=Micromonospora luteifusca TaxID=709860 RepID=A0ABS2LMU8_9ACTN|nr:discoidin domain-containing protein [Micromonospora luteifusca]MBM7489498.1 hypothetical protein [Micromonospora luteifusca]